MCGRYQLLIPFRELVALYGTQLTVEFLNGLDSTERSSGKIVRINCRPTDDVPIVKLEGNAPVIVWARWGYPKLWEEGKTKEPWKRQPLINTKAETALDKTTWRESTIRRRCIIPTTGFYEWLNIDGGKYPLHFRSTEAVCSIAGIWEEFYIHGRQSTCLSVITTDANQSVSDIHGRMPLILDKRDETDWLGTKDHSRLMSILASKPANLSRSPVSTALNNSQSRDSSLLVADWSEDEVTTRQGSLW